MSQDPKILRWGAPAREAPQLQLAKGYVGILFALYALQILFRSSLPSLADYSDWIYEGVLLRNHLLGLADSAHALKHYPVPNVAASVGIGILALLFSWQMAARLWLCILVLLSFATSAHMLRTLRASAVLWLFVPASIFLNVNLWYGFVNFQLGLCWTVLFASLLLRNERRDWIFGALLTAAFFSHMIPFAFCGLMLILYALQTGRLRLLWQLLPGALLSFWYVAGRFFLAHNADGDAGMISTVRTYSAAFWAYKVNSYLKSLGFINPGTKQGSVAIGVLGTVPFILTLCLDFLLCGVVAWSLLRAAIAAYRERKAERFLWTAALVLFPVYLFSPGTMLGISDPGSRLLQVTLAVVLFLCGGAATRFHRLLRLGATCAVLLEFAGLLLFTRVAFSPEKKALNLPFLPRELVVFAHIPDHAEDFYLEGLRKGDMGLHIFPTAMFLNTPAAKTRVVSDSTSSVEGR